MIFAKSCVRNDEKKNNTCNIRCLVDNSFVSSSKRTSVLYCKLTDFNRNYLLYYFLQKHNNPTTSTFFRAQEAAAAACRKEPLGYYGIAICNPHLTDGPFQLGCSV